MTRASLDPELDRPTEPTRVYMVDIVVADQVIVELKAAAGLADAHTAQRFNDPRASRLPVGLLMNCGTPRPQWRRVIR